MNHVQVVWRQALSRRCLESFELARLNSATPLPSPVRYRTTHLYNNKKTVYTHERLGLLRSCRSTWEEGRASVCTLTQREHFVQRDCSLRQRGERGREKETGREITSSIGVPQVWSVRFRRPGQRGLRPCLQHRPPVTAPPASCRHDV